MATSVMARNRNEVDPSEVGVVPLIGPRQRLPAWLPLIDPGCTNSSSWKSPEVPFVAAAPMWLQTMIQSSLILLGAAGLPECAFELVGAFGATGAGLVAGSGVLPLGAAHKAVDPDPPARSATNARDHGELVRF
jgi:hypothetical protein